MISPYSTCHTINILSHKFPENSQEISLGQIMKTEKNNSRIKVNFPSQLESDKAFYMASNLYGPLFYKIEVEEKKALSILPKKQLSQHQHEKKILMSDKIVLRIETQDNSYTVASTPETDIT